MIKKLSIVIVCSFFCILSVSAQEKIADNKFENSFVFKIGSGKARVPTVEFINQITCRVETSTNQPSGLAVKSYKIWLMHADGQPTEVIENQGQPFTDDTILAISKLKPQDHITFSDILTRDKEGNEIKVKDATYSLY